MRFILVAVVAVLAHAQTRSDPSVVLEQARTRFGAAARSLEKYVCLETVDRSYYQRVAPRDATASDAAEPVCGPGKGADSLQLESTDRVRFEVSVSDGRELHSWPGAKGFDVRDVDELVREGPVSTGAFGAYLDSIFGHPGVTFQFNGEQTADGKTLFVYRYRVSLEASRLHVKVGDAWRPTAYEGDFRVDPQSLDLDRLTIRIDGLPPGAPFCAASATLNYQRLHIGDSEVLLPRQSQLEVVLDKTRETRNITSFASCREYQADSEMLLDAPAGDAGGAAGNSGRRSVALPIGLPVKLALTQPIDTATAAAGDQIAATVVKPVRRAGDGEELIPAGAIVRGRIRRVEHHVSPTPYFLVAMAFNRVEVRGVVLPFVARSEPDPRLVKQLEANLDIRATGIWFWDVGTLLFPTNKSRMVIPAGFESKWFTLATGGR